MKLFKFGFMAIVGLIVTLVIAMLNVKYGAGLIAANFVIAGFTEEQQKSFNDFMKKQGDDIQAKVKSLIETLKETELIKGIQSVLTGLDGKDGKISIMQKQLDQIATDFKKLEMGGGAPEAKDLSLAEAIKSLLGSEEFKTAKANKFKGAQPFSVKATTANITGTVNLTQMKPGISFAPEMMLSFIPNANVGVVGQDKNILGWMEGTYTSNAGYVGEGTGQATADAGTATEKTRKLSKISAKLVLTAEMLEDADYIASQFKIKMQTKAMLFADKEFYAGDGNDATQPNHIYGIKGAATAYAAPDGVAGTVSNANIGDLVDAVILQAENALQNGLNIVWMNPADFYRLKKTKTTTGEYLFVKDVNGAYTINGLRVIKNANVTANTMTFADSSKIQIWWKRYPELKISQMDGNNFIDDVYTAVMFLRVQGLIEALDQTAVIHVSDITAAVDELNKITA